MTRQRRAAPSAASSPSSPYITAAGYAALQREQKAIWTKRAEVVRALSAAAAEGDRSENAEYIYRKKQLAEIDRRIRYLQRRLPALNVVTSVGDASKVFFGAWVTLQRLDADEDDADGKEYRIVGGDEIDSDSRKGYISVDSPLARALLKREVGDEVEVRIGDAKRRFLIRAIRYE